VYTSVALLNSIVCESCCLHPTSAEQTIREAIAARAPLVLAYAGDRGPIRTVHPQVLFLTAAGQLCVDCHQVAGYTSSGKPLPGWRDFTVAKIERVELTAGSFGTAPGLNLDAPKYARVLAHV
jgi:hypothetical protein